MEFKQGQLVSILGCSQALETKYLAPINAACSKYNITTILQLAAFIAQVGHESGRLATVVENLNYSAEGLLRTWPSRFTAATAASAARKPEQIANIVYADRLGNGNTASGDGWKYRGRGLIQITGKVNYDAYSQSSGKNAVKSPDLLLEPIDAALSAAWFWNSKSLNSYADRSDFLTITKRINGGTNGQADRELLYKKALIVLNGGVPPKDDVVDKAPMPAPADGSPTSNVSNQKTPGAQNSSIVEPRAALGSDSKSKYPWNFVNVSRSGHYTEVDDTPGYERLNMTHRTGSYWEIDNTGTFTMKSVLDLYQISKYDSYGYVGGNYTQQVKGQSYRQSDGDMIFKANGQVFVNANKVQMNTGMLAVSGEINSPNINSMIFGPMGGLAFGDLLAKQSLVAYDIIKGTAPMLGSSLGFKSAPGSNLSGSADGKMTNNLSNFAPNGTPWVTNGIKTAATVVSALAVASGISDLLKSSKVDEYVDRAINSSANSIATEELKRSSETPVFLKHVTFDKPTLISQSNSINVPDPTIYVNNLHTIVNSSGVGRLHMSNGVKWVPIGDAAQADHDYTDEQIAIVIDKINQNEVKSTNQILAEAQERADAILNEARERQNALEEEARARQQEIVSGLLAEAVARGAAIQAESVIRQTEDESLSNRILTLTASTDENIAAAIAEEREARTTAIEAEAFLRLQLAAKVDDEVASITDELTVQANETSALTTRLTNYISSNDQAIASFKTEINTKVDDQGNAFSTRLDAQQAANEENAAMITSETQARVSEDAALASRIDTVFAETNSNAVAIQNEVTARTDADTALGSQINTLVATVSGMRQGVNLLPNAGFSVITTEGTGTRPTGWLYEYYSGDNAISSYNAQVLNNGPDGYNFARFNIVASKDTNMARFGLRIEDGVAQTVEKFRPNVDYIIAARFRTTNDADVGKIISLSDTNFPFESTIIGGDGLLTKEWKWFILRIKWTNLNLTHRDFYLNYEYSNFTSQGNHTFDVATPIVSEGSSFLGFNLGDDARILVNTAAITDERTVRAEADSALATQINTVSSRTDAAAKTADWTGVQGRPLDTNNLILTPSFEDGLLKTWANSGGELVTTEVPSSSFPNKYYMRIVGRRDTYENNSFPVSPGEKFYVSAFFFTSQTTYQSALGLQFLDKDGAILGWNAGAVAPAGLSTWTKYSGSFSVPPNSVKAVPWVQIGGFTDLGYIGICNMSISRAEPGATVGATWGVDVKGAEEVIQELANISSDNVLSKGEKPTVLLNWNTIDAEKDGIRNQADAYGVNRVAYDTAFQNLSNYLIGIGPGNSGWADYTVDSPIDGPTFRARWNSYYTAKQNILNAITAQVKALADQGISQNAASIVTEQQARSDGDSANAQAIQTVSSTVSGHTATIQQQSSSIQGVQANYGIKINNNGYIAGYGLLSEPVDGVPLSSFNILADKFAIQAPSLNNGAPVVPFSVDTTTNPPTIALNGLIQVGTSDGTGGKNIAFNSGPSKRTIQGYSVGYNTVGSAPVIAQSFDPYRPTGSGGVYIRFTGTPGNGTTCDINNAPAGGYYSVIAGSMYEASVYLSNHRCSAAVGIIFVDSNNNYISEIRGNVVSVPSVTTNINGWSRSFVIGTAPSNAASAYISIRSYYNGQSDCYTFASMLYFGQAGAKQIQPSPWSPSGVTTISGGMIEANSITADTLSVSQLSAITSDIGLMRTATSGQRTEIDSNGVRVYDGNNTLRVRLGIW